MSRFSRCSILSLSIVLLGSLCFFAYAQRETYPDNSAERASYASKKECVSEFDIDTINFLDPFFLEETKVNPSILIEYFTCRAALNNDVSECDKLGPGVAECRRQFNGRQGFFARLILARGSRQPVTRKVLNACIEQIDFGKKACQQYMEAFIKADTSICKSHPFVKGQSTCEGFITLNEKIVRDRSVEDMIFYLKAISDLSVGECRKIKKKAWRRECEAYVTGDETICEQCDGFKNFRDIYCSEILR